MNQEGYILTSPIAEGEIKAIANGSILYQVQMITLNKISPRQPQHLTV